MQKAKPQKVKSLYRIADVSRLVGVSASTLRLWEQHGILTPARSDARYRLYSNDELERARHARRLREVQGLGLRAIRDVLNNGLPTGARDGATPGAEPSSEIGPRMRSLRQRRGLSMREVAARARLSPSALSSFERTSQGLSAAALHRLAGICGTTLTELSGVDWPGGEQVIPAGQGRKLPFLGEGIRVEQLAEGQRMMDCQRWVLEAGAGSEGTYSHEGEEFIQVVEGHFEVELDYERTIALGTGDSIYFESSRPHRWRNPGPERCVLLWVNTPPSF